MDRPTVFDSILVEFHALDQSTMIEKGGRYVVTEGMSKPARSESMPLSHRECLRQLHRLRYRGGTANRDKAEAARKELGEHMRNILALDTSSYQKPIQVDLVLNAEAFWVLPFEACLDSNDQPSFVDKKPPVVLTRRIRGAFQHKQRVWPTKPRVLFITARKSVDLEQSLIDSNRNGLLKALEPWLGGLEKSADSNQDLPYLSTLKDPNLRGIEDTLARAREEGKPFTHIHILAHGTPIQGEIPEEYWWGLQLGPGSPVDPEELAGAIAPNDGLPAVVTLAACDTGNVANVFSKKSFAQELHRAGVPVVLAPQLPLRKEGSAVIAEKFYAPLFRGLDVREALNDVRTALYAARGKTGHDWLSVAAYVQLPEGYHDLLVETGLQADLGLLDAADKAAKELKSNASRNDFIKIGDSLRKHMQSIEKRGEELAQIGRKSGELWQEAQGLLGSAHKRLSQLLFNQYKQFEDNEALAQSVECLAKAKLHYQQAYEANPANHWVGGQWISLSAIVDGRIDDPFSWDMQHYGAVKRREKDVKDFWVCGTLAELLLIAPLAGRGDRMDEAKAALEDMKVRVGGPPKDDTPIKSTQRQLERYTTWWTKNNGFFKEAERDLALEAQELLNALN